MPIYKRSPYDLTGACVNAVNEETGEYYLRWILPEDVLDGMNRGLTVAEIAVELNAPIDIIEHAVAQVPMMMAWRRHIAQQEGEASEELLPQLPAHYQKG